MLVGLGIIYAGGVSWLAAAFVHSLTTAMATGLAPFVILDVLKLTAAAMILPQAWRLLGPRLE
jgi:biotin transport system substrate-specific component